LSLSRKVAHDLIFEQPKVRTWKAGYIKGGVTSVEKQVELEDRINRSVQIEMKWGAWEVCRSGHALAWHVERAGQDLSTSDWVWVG
jgi:hypothetical protein